MLKERIEYLSKRKQISRKDLVEGLVTQAHFANILADRYPLPEDLAEAIASRLAASYLLHAADQSEETLERAEAILHSCPCRLRPYRKTPCMRWKIGMMR